MKRLLGWILKLAVIAVIAGVVVYQVRFAPLAVESHVVQRGTIVAEIMGTGTLEARVATTISPKISGRIQQVLVDQGDRVSAGTLLVQLDAEELSQQVAIAEANVSAASAGLERLKTDKVRAAAIFSQAQKSNDRFQSLVSRKATSQDEADKATEALAVAAAGMSTAEAAITEGQQELVAAQQTLEYHRTRLRETQIVSPFDGLIVQRSREPGDVVVPGGSILTLISLDELWISAWVDETVMAQLEPNQTARVVFRSEAERSYPGHVVRLGREADRETREFVVDVRVEELPANWAVGQRAEVFIEVARKDNVVTVPARMIVNRVGQRGVYVNEANAASWREVELGLRNRHDVEVLLGLDAAAEVLLPADPRTTLKEGRNISSTLAAP